MVDRFTVGRGHVDRRLELPVGLARSVSSWYLVSGLLVMFVGFYSPRATSNVALD